ncbi:MAG: carbohydrate kinase [Bacteroidales bacterium]|nr:carbohydrate kinase [Bacteroidales bacterium]
MDKPIVIGLGEILWDMLPSGKQLGGAPANFAWHAAQCGCQGVAVSAVGKDALGYEILSLVKSHSLGDGVQLVDFPTGTVEVLLDNKGVPSYNIIENVAWDNIQWTPRLEAIANSADAVCFGSLAQRSPVSRDTIRRFRKIVSQRPHALVVFDMNLRQDFYSTEILEESMRDANILKINDEELGTIQRLGLAEEGDITEACKSLIDKYGLRIVILTCGADGSHVFTKDEHSILPTPKVTVADTVGAGDSFTGAFVASLLQGKTIKEAHRRAVEVSAYVCTQHGAMPSYNLKALHG